MFKKKFDLKLEDLVYVYSYNVWASALFIGKNKIENDERIAMVFRIDPFKLDKVITNNKYFTIRNIQIIQLYFKQNKSYKEIAEMYGLSETRVMQIIRKILRES